MTLPEVIYKLGEDFMLLLFVLTVAYWFMVRGS